MWCRATRGRKHASARHRQQDRAWHRLCSRRIIMKLTADSLNHHGHSEQEIHGCRGASLATIGHRARGGLRAAALLAAATVWLVQPGQAMAQETRVETIRQEQADKKDTVTPSELNGVEKIVRRLENWGWLTGEPRGAYPVLDSVYPGGGFAAGLGARKPFGDDGAIDVIGAYSINSFWRVQTDVSLPTFASNRGRVSLTARYLDAPDVKVLRRRRGLGQGRQDGFRLHAVGRRRTSRLRRQPAFLRWRRRQLHRYRNRVRRHRGVDRGAVLTSRHPGPRARPVQVCQRHSAGDLRLAAADGLRGLRRSVSRAGRRLPRERQRPATRTARSRRR